MYIYPLLMNEGEHVWLPMEGQARIVRYLKSPARQCATAAVLRISIFEALKLLKGVLVSPAGTCVESQGAPEHGSISRVASPMLKIGELPPYKKTLGMRDTNRESGRNRGIWQSLMCVCEAPDGFLGIPRAAGSTIWETLSYRIISYTKHYW